MTALSPGSPTEAAARAGTAAGVLALQGAPAVGLPLWFLGTGLLALAVLPVLLWMRPEILSTYHYNQYVVAATHLTVLGWVGSLVFGALYQLVPVVLETRLYSERLARWHFLCHLIGFAGMVWMFWEWNLKQVGHFGSALALGAALGIYNLVRTLGRAPRRSWITFTVASALFWLGATVTVGLGIAAAKCTYESAARLSPASPLGALVHALEATATYLKRFDQMGLMHAHAHLGVVGAYVVLLVGVSYKLVPMFSLSPAPHAGRVWASLLLLNLAVLGSFFTILHRSDAKLIFTLLGVAGVGLYGWELVRLLRQRRRPVLDLPLRYFLTGLVWLGATCGLAVYLSWPGLALTSRVGQVENLYGLWALLGALSFCLLGMLYKILPFLVWYRRYGPWIGRQPVPALHELYGSGLLRAALGLHGLALLVLSAATWWGHATSVRYGAVLLGAAVVSHLVNAGRILSHLWRSVPSPVPAGASLSSMVS